MHLVLLNQYYPPDEAPTGVMLEAVAERLGRDGHAVTVLCGYGGYASAKAAQPGGADPECPGAPPSGVRVFRIRATRFGRGSHLGRLLDYASFYLGVAWKLLWMKPRPDRIVALTTPPYLSVLARIFSRIRGGDHAHWVMDLYPDVMTAHGMLRERSAANRILAWLTRWSFGGDRCAAVVSLGPDMAKRVARYLPAHRESEQVPLWATSPRLEEDGEAVRRWRRDRGWDDQDLILLYSGNMGLGHRFAEFLAAAERLSASGGEAGRTVRFVFTGRGKRREEIEAFVKEHPDCGVEVGDYVPREALAVHLASADVHLASLEPAWDGTMVPSKIQGIFSIGRPVVFVGTTGCAIGEWIGESGGGWVIEPGEVDALVAAIRESRDVGECEARGRAAQAFASEQFDRERNARKLGEIFSRSGVSRPEQDEKEPTPTPGRAGAGAGVWFLRVVAALFWILALALSGAVLYLSWTADSQMRRVKWIPEWLAEWADSGGEIENMRTGVPLAAAGLLFTLSWKLSGLRHWVLGGIGMALMVVLVAEAGQFFLPARTPDWGDMWWGAVGAAGGVLIGAILSGVIWLGRKARDGAALARLAQRMKKNL